MNKIDAAGLKIDNLSKQELLDQLTARLKLGGKTFITTPYSEFLYRCLRDPRLLETLNQADFAVPDGIGIFWAAKFLSIPLTAKSYYGKILQAWWQAKYTLWAILFYPKFIRSAFKEKISGSELIWDLAKLAAREKKKIYLLGGFGDTPKIVADKFKSLGAQVEHSSKNPDDQSIINDIKGSGADFLFVAFGPIRQEQWIVENMGELPCKLYIGLGGSFDYIAQKQPSPPRFMRTMGLEWLFRLVTQPKRGKRIWQATFGLVIALIKYKVFMSLPYRPNVIGIVINKNNEALLVKINPTDSHPAAKTFGRFPENYWTFPQGGTDGEELVKAAAREVQEETGIKDIELFKISDKRHEYIWKKFPPFFTSRRYQYKGQLQHIVYFKFTGNNDEIKLDNWELVDFRWTPISELAATVTENRLKVAAIVQEDLKDLAKVT